MMRDAWTNTRFMALWVAGSVLVLIVVSIIAALLLLLFGFLATVIWINQERLPGLIDGLLFAVTLCSLIGVWWGLLAGNLQKWLLRQQSGESFHGWALATVIGAVLGVTIMAFVVGAQVLPKIGSPAISNATIIFLTMQIMVIPLAIMSIAQLPILWRYVRGAWTWVLAHVVAGVVLVSLFLAGTSSGATGVGTPAAAFLLLVMLAAPGIVTGFAMVWLLVNNGRYR